MKPPLVIKDCSIGRSSAGLTLLELIVAATILSILTMMALPLAKVTIKRQQEKRLRQALWEMRDAIDRYKDMADRGGFQIKADSYGYPPALEDLVKGVDIRGKKVRFLRRIPVDPMSHSAEWGMHSMQDDPENRGQTSAVHPSVLIFSFPHIFSPALVAAIQFTLQPRSTAAGAIYLFVQSRCDHRAENA